MRASSRCRGGMGSRTVPPPSVVSARRITRSPRAATTGDARRSWAKRSPRRTTRAVQCAVPRCTCTRASSAIGAISSRRTSRRYERRVPTRRDERLSSHDVAPLDPGKAHRDALAGLRAIDVTVVHLDAADPHVATRRLEPQLVSRADRARPERAGHNRAEAGDRERTVDVQPSRPVRTHVLDGVGDRVRARYEARRGPRPVFALTRTTSAPGTSSWPPRRRARQCPRRLRRPW